jgi:hypothetical protein
MPARAWGEMCMDSEYGGAPLWATALAVTVAAAGKP